MAHRFGFFRAGGFDQVRIDTAQDLLALKELDQKLWMALSCPIKGIEFDARTLALIDTDGDGIIRPPELLAAIDWAAERLADVNVFGLKLDGVPLAAIRQDESTQSLRDAALGILGARGSEAGAVVSVYAASAAETEFSARALAAWEASGDAVHSLPSREAAIAAVEAIAAVKEKLDDYFVRCRLAAFEPKAREALNISEESFRQLGANALSRSTEGLVALPLAQVTDQPPTLRLDAGINPAWQERIEIFVKSVVEPLLGERTSLSEDEWQSVQDKLVPFVAWQAARPTTLSDSAVAEAVRDLERLARYVRDLLPLANNLVAFRDFYTHRGPATFQLGTLYLDGRSADLCVAVNDVARHAALATLSRMCLVYCDCVRNDERLSIAAAFTAGDSDQLMPGRNGVFYDRQGRDWHATVTKLVDHPISLRQAFWSPYKRLMRLVAEQVQKLTAGKATQVDAQLNQAATGATKSEAPHSAVPVAFDAAKLAGVFAAIGLAVGAIGTAVASLVTGLLGLKWWQVPLALAGLVLLISGPAVVLAWFRLRARNLGPILDANGWAVNARAKINVPFGTSLTQLARLPEGAERTLTDPYAEREQPWLLYFILLTIFFAALAWWTQ